MADWLQLLEFRGRLSRIGFWRAYLKIFFAASVVWVLALFASLAVGAWAAPLFLPLFLLLVANFAIVVRRLHDRGRSFWWAIAFFVLPNAMLVAVGLLRAGPLAAILLLVVSLAGTVLSLWGTVEVCLLRSSPRGARFDPEAALA
jgi:uncharacterized membrane protein YhaH (DUF805 family)